MRSLSTEWDLQDMLRRELAHVTEQLVVEHRMTLDWRQRYYACERTCASLEKKLATARKKLAAKAGQGTRDTEDDETVPL